MRTLIILILTALALTATAQNDEQQAFQKFGKITEQDFQPTVYDDLGYDAVVISNEKKMYIDIYNGQLRIYNAYHTRLKALKDGFYDAQLFTIRYSGRYEYEKLLTPRCWVFRLNGSKISTLKTKYKNIRFIDRDSLESRIEITPPAILKGDIIDIEYTIATFDFVLPPIWKFGGQYPCLASRLTTMFPYFMKYKFDTKGTFADDIQHTEKTDQFVSLHYTYSSNDNPRSFRYQLGRADRLTFIYKFGANFDIFTMTNIMPDDIQDTQHTSRLYGTAAVRMRAAKFTQDIGYTDLHYAAWQQLTHLIYTYADPDNRYISQNEAWYKPYNPGYVLVSSDSWERLYKRQRKNPDFWKAMMKAVDIPAELRPLIDPDEPLDTLKAAEKIYDYVCKNIAWDSTYANHTTRSIENVLKSRRGNSAEINMALVTLLRRTGVSALAAMTSTTDFGEVDSSYANTSQFNTVLACVPYEERLIILDATDPLKQFGKVTPHRYDRLMWFSSPFKYFFGEAEFADDKNTLLKKIDEDM